MRSIFCAATLLRRGVRWLPTMIKSTLYSFLMVGFLTLTLHLKTFHSKSEGKPFRRTGQIPQVVLWKNANCNPAVSLDSDRPCDIHFAENKLDASVWIEDLIFISCYNADCPRGAFRWARGVIISKRVDTLVFTPPGGFEGISFTTSCTGFSPGRAPFFFQHMNLKVE